MPALAGTPIVRHVWQHRTEPDRIHFVANGGSADRRLYVDRGQPFFDVLAEALRPEGYTGSASTAREHAPEPLSA